MGILFIIFVILGFLFFVIPITGKILLIRYIIKKSSINQPADAFEKEKNEMILKARAERNKLVNWKKEYIEKLTNDLDFNHMSSIVRKFNGFIYSLDGERLVAFRRIDRGNSNITSKIIAIANNIEIFFSQKQNEVLIYLNSEYLGKLIHHSDNVLILNHQNNTIGKLSERDNEKEHYTIEMNNEKIAYVMKNSERRTILRNIFYEPYSTYALEKDPLIKNPVSKTTILTLHRELNEIEYDWVLSIAIYEIIYFGIDFTQ